VGYVRSLPAASRPLVFGGGSTRFFESTDVADRAHAAGTIGDVVMELTRIYQPPPRVLVTSEVSERDSIGPAELVATLCRSVRVDRKRPCLEVYAVDTEKLR
jgi:hypothetical protein